MNSFNEKTPGELGCFGGIENGQSELQAFVPPSPDMYIIAENTAKVKSESSADAEIRDYQYGFCCQGVASPREVVDADVLFEKACAADASITGKTDFFASMHTYPAAFIERVARTGKTAGYDGPCHSKKLWVDFDNENLEIALQNLIRFQDYLFTLSGGVLKPEHVISALSGGKGYHAGISLVAFGSPPPSESFSAECKAVVCELARRAGASIDAKVYDKVRLFRELNSRHGKTGLFKIPLAHHEITAHGALPWILERAKSPRKLLLNGDDGQSDGVLFTQSVAPIQEHYCPIKNPVKIAVWSYRLTRFL